MNDDIKLVQACCGGDARAFEAIVSRYQALVCAITYSAVGHRDISEELAQETFVQAWKQIGKLKEADKFRPWLCSIARSIVCNHFRAQKRTPVVQFDMADLPTDKGKPTPPETLIRKEEEEMVHTALMQIPREYREPLVLFYRQDHSITQVAEIMGLTEAAVRTRLHRGRLMLREQIESKIETTLKKTAPTAAFTRAVMAAVGAGLTVGIAGSAAAGTTAASTGSSSALTAASGLLTATSAKIASIAAVIVITAGVVIYSTKELSAPTPSQITNEQPVVSREAVAAIPMNMVIEPRVKVGSKPAAFAPSQTGTPDPTPQLTEFVQTVTTPILSNLPPVRHPDWPSLDEPVKYIYTESKLVSVDGTTGTSKFWTRLPDAFRDEGQFDKITIDNGRQRLVLDPNTLQARLESTWYSDGKMTWQFQQLLEEHPAVIQVKLFRDPNSVPEMKLMPVARNNDTQTIIYKIEQEDLKGIDFTAWVDQRTLLPEKIEAIVTGEPNQYGNVTGGTFIFDFAPIDDAVFSTDIPSEYQILLPKQPNTFSGQVVDLLGNPVANAEVYLYHCTLRKQKPLSGRSNQDGEFEILVPPFEVGFNSTVAFWATVPDDPEFIGWTLLMDPWKSYPYPLAGMIPGSPGAIKSSEDFFYEKTENGSRYRGSWCVGASDIILVMEPGNPITGQIKDVYDCPVPDAVVTVDIENLSDIYGNPIYTTGFPMAMLQTGTDANGWFFLGNLPRLWKNCGFSIAVNPAPETGLVRDAKRIRIQDPNTPLQADFILPYKGPTVRGIVVDNYGTPLPERYIDIRVNRKSFPGYLRKTDKDGRFEFSNCPADAGLQIRAELSHNSMAPHEPEKYKSYVYYPDTTVNVGYVPEKEEYEVKLIAIKPELEIEALLVDSAGNPLPYFPVEIRTDNGPIPTQWQQERRLKQRTDENGIVRFINAPEMPGLRLTCSTAVGHISDRSETEEMRQYFEQLESDYSNYAWTEIAVPLVPEQMKYSMRITLLTNEESELRKHSDSHAAVD